MNDAILVTGGAGYIGSHTARRLLEAGRRVIVVDNFSTGHRAVGSLFRKIYGPEKFQLEEIDLLDQGAAAAVFDRHEISGIIDFAARSLVGESQQQPRLYFEQNVLAFCNLVAASDGVPIVKSSTAASYGEPDAKYVPLAESYQQNCVDDGQFATSQLRPAEVTFDELLGWYENEVAEHAPSLALQDDDREHLKIPTNVYGITKVMDERILHRCGCREGRRFVALRYFNAAGADGSGLIGEDHDPESHLIPLVLQVALGQREQIVIFGDDYATEDGTAVRDYISVDELADAHVKTLDYLLGGGASQTFNLGTRNGYSVRQIIETARRVTGEEIVAETGPRRSGDPALLVADAGKIEQALGWRSTETLEQTITSAWNWHRGHPDGYGDAGV